MQGFNLSDTTRPFDWTSKYLGLELDQWIALQGRPRSLTQLQRMGYNVNVGDVQHLGNLDNQYFVNLLNEQWTEANGVYVNAGMTLSMTPYDMTVLWSPPHKAVAQRFAEDNKLFVKTYREAWTRLMNMDRYSGPTTNACE